MDALLEEPISTHVIDNQMNLENETEQSLQSSIFNFDSTTKDMDGQGKKTLFNIRFTSLGKRLSDRIETECDHMKTGVQKPGVNGGKRSRRVGHVLSEDFSEIEVLEFVQHKATRFSRKISSTDFNEHKESEWIDYDPGDSIRSPSDINSQWKFSPSIHAAAPSNDNPENQHKSISLDPEEYDPKDHVLTTKEFIPTIDSKNSQKFLRTSSLDNLPSTIQKSLESSALRTNLFVSDKNRKVHSSQILLPLELMDHSETSDKCFISSFENHYDSGVYNSHSKLTDDSGLGRSNSKLTDDSGIYNSRLKLTDDSGIYNSHLKLTDDNRAFSSISKLTDDSGSGRNHSRQKDDNEVSSSNLELTASSVLTISSPRLTDGFRVAKSISNIPDENSFTAPSLVNEFKPLSKQTFQLGTAFTEFVHIENFRSSQGNRSSHLDQSQVSKYNKQLESLLKAGSSKALKVYLRNSQWPAESAQRKHQWDKVCYFLLKAQGHIYQKLVEGMTSEDKVESKTLPPIVDSDCQQTYFLNASGLDTAKTVINLLSHLHPDITYCPLLYPMTCLFLHYMAPDVCFDCLQALLHSSSYFTQTTIKTEAAKYVLRDLARKYAKPAYDLMLHSTLKVEAIFENWKWWIFRDVPFQYLVRIIDSFLLEGYKVFYRITLAIVSLYAKQHTRQGNQSWTAAELSADISRFCSNLSIDPRKFLQVGFGIRGLSRKEIFKLHEKYEAYLATVPTRKISRYVARLREIVPSAIITPEMFQNIWQWIPDRLSLMTLELLFCSNEHGTAIRTLYARTEYASQTIMAIKTTSNEIFGAFCSSSWFTRHEKNKPKTSFFGTGETFVFSLFPVMRRYQWAGLLANPPDQITDFFMAGDDEMLTIGSGNGAAIYLDAMMNRCRSTHCDTFHNEPLCPDSDFRFVVRLLPWYH